MRFKNRPRGSDLPEVNLVPMMDVLMTVLTFFIIISMTLRGQQLANVRLPEASNESDSAMVEAEPFIVGLSDQGDILLDNQVVSLEQLTRQMQSFLSENPEGRILLKADRSLNYSEVNALLQTMRDIGGNQVSLAFDRGS
ncbi:ExbD/TolR family protein [Egbenema bharatensis]|uniref:ExbD/TolR family protein n=1 Tax=Egbenema bharatensis TaxID=3463334 RepID=UPI003A835461